MVPWRPKRFLLSSFVACCVLVCIMLVSSVMETDQAAEKELLYKVAELQNRLKHAEMVNQERREDILELSELLRRLSPRKLESVKAAPDYENASGRRGNSTHRFGRGALSSAAHNSLQEDFAAPSLLSNDVSLPSVYQYLPHLLNHPNALSPAFKLSKDRPRVSVVLGIPTVRRQVQSYLGNTLENLFDNMNDAERDETLIVVFVGDMDESYVHEVAKDVSSRFPQHVASGLIEVIAPSPNFYPNLTAIPATLGDTPERTRWRTKQNLDFAYLMMYCRNRGTYYVQLEDDILSKPSFITTMKSYASQKTSERADWVILDFCQLGFIGKMFRTVQLPALVHFLLMFYADKPSDWLLDNMIQTKVCRFDQSPKHCKKNKDAVWIHHKPSLFQHVGTHSSLAGKVQKLKDKGFGKILLHKPHKNPPATVKSDLKEYHNYKLARAYAGETYFWGLLPQPGDTLMFHFSPPVRISRFLLRSGNNEHPLDRFYNTSVEALPVVPVKPDVKKAFAALPDGFFVVGRFNDQGVAEGNQTAVLGQLEKIRMTVHSESDKWAMLSEADVLIGDLQWCSPFSQLMTNSESLIQEAFTVAPKSSHLSTMSEDVKSVQVVLPPPPPPPPPRSLSADSVTSLTRPVAKSVDLHEEISKAASNAACCGKAGADFGLQILVGSQSRKFLPRIQDGPVCGLVALMMGADLVGLDADRWKPSDLLETARHMGLTWNGEMYSADGLARLGSCLWPELLCTVCSIEDHTKLLAHLTLRKPVLVPYDTSPNHYPACFNGTNAHWAVLAGAFFREASRSNGEDIWFCAFQGKSAYLGAWKYADLRRSNLNLTQEGDKRRGQVLLPDGSVDKGLRGKAILVDLVANLSNGVKCSVDKTD